MTFSEVKTTLLANGRKVKTCDFYHGSALAADYPALIEAGLPLAVWLYLTGIVTDVLLAEFPGADLNAQGVYIANVTLTNPDKDIYIFGGTATITLTGNNSCNIYLLKGSLVLTTEDNSRAAVQTHNVTTFTADVTDSSMVCTTTRNESTQIIELFDSAAATIEAKGESLATVTANTGTHAALYGWHMAVINYEGAGAFEIYQAQGSTIQPVTPP